METLKTSTKLLLVCAVVLLLVLVAGPLGYRFELAALGPSLLSLLVALVGAALVSLGGLFLLVGAIRARLPANRSMLLVAMGLCLIPVLVVAPWVVAGRSAPPIHDITTDTRDPPAFTVLLEERKKSPNGADYGSAAWPARKLARAQQEAYPHVQPIISRLAVPDAVARAEAVLKDMGLDVAGVYPETGMLEATHTSLWFGFKDDLVVRVRPKARGSRVDLRSMSRVGQNDFGMNAKRIADFANRFSQQD